MKYSILDLKNVFDKETNIFKVYFQNKFVMEVGHRGSENFNPPSLVSHPSHTINEYLSEPYIIAGGYDNCDLYNIKGKKLTDFKFWTILNSPIIYNGEEYFQVRTSKNKSGIINNKGDVIIPFEYDEDINLGIFISIQTNGKLYVKKGGQFGIIDLENNFIEPLQNSWHKVKIQQLHDLGLWSDE